MEESNRDIQCLIKLKKQRPAFSRMISWEMSQATDTQYGKKVKQKKKQKSKDGANQGNADGDIDDVNEETDSGSAASSDYETANEDMVDELELSGAISSINTGTSFDTADVAVEEDLDSEDDDEEEEEDDPFETIATEPASGDNQPVRRRRLSKRQKRKRSKLFRVTYIDEFANLAGLYNFDEDIKTAITDVSENAGSVDICCPVPTLAELCLKATRQRRKRNQSGQRTSTSTPLPIGIKRIIKDWRFHQETLDKQLSFFLNFVLPSCCDQKDIKLSNVYHSTADKHEFNFPVRSVWSSAAHPTNKDCGFQYPSERATAFLYNPTMRCLSKDISGSLSYTDINIYDNLYPASTHVQSALATTIDLMLPSTLSDRVRHRSCSTDSEVIENASKTAVIRVKRALWSRYPHLVDHLYNRVLPYVMWARGNIGQATQMFQSLVDKETKSQYKAMYLSEIACMHSMFGDPSTAVSFYKLASEVTLTEEATSKEQVIAEVTEQTQVLLASVYDCGLLTQEKASKSIHHWGTAVNLGTPKTATGLGAVYSYLGLHACHLSDACWSEAERRLRSWLGSNKYIHYYLALVLALKGNGPESTQEFRNLKMQTFTDHPGENIYSYQERNDKKNPLNPLITIVKGQRTPVKPLKVVWRTQLRPPRLTNDKPMEADISSPALHLYISENGHLTGDMQMLMPPIRQVELDLYTGSLVLSNLPSFTCTWQTVKFQPDDYLITDFMVPTPYQIYSHENGTQVHLVAPSLTPPNKSSGTCGLPRCPMVLTWKGPEGQTARINLVAAAKDACMKSLDKRIAGTSRKYTELQEGLLRQLADVAYARGFTLSYEKLTNAVSRISYHNNSKIKASKKKQNSLKETQDQKKGKDSDVKIIKSMIPKTLTTYLDTLRIDISDEPFQYGKGLVLHLELESQHHLMFIDTSSRESFLDYRMVPRKKEDWIDQSRPGTHSTDANFFMAYITSIVSIYNEKGQQFQSINIDALNRYDHPNNSINLCSLGGYVFGVNKDRLGVWRTIIGLEECEPDFDANLTSCLAPYWELEDDRKQIENLIAMGRETQGKGHFLFLHMSMGLGFMDPDTQEMIPLTLPEDCNVKLTDDSKVILGRFEECTVHRENFFTEEDTAICRFAVTTENKLFLFSMSHKLGSDQLQATLLCYLFLPGQVKEVCIIGKEVGMLVSLTQHYDHDLNYREHVLHFRNDGLLYGTLLCLGHGPHSFCPVYLHGNKDGSSEPGWYVYMRDGHDGILCVKLF